MKNNRWYIYQKERFPVLMYIPMILAFSFSAISYSSIMRKGEISPESVIVSFITSFTFFMLLRIADEHKDYEDDCQYRPYRPVPRGLVALKELFWIGVGIVMLQLICCLLLSVKLLPLLVVIWIYYALMTKEFFVSKWLKGHMAMYMFSHMLIMPCLDMYAAACDFLPEGSYDMMLLFVWFVMSSLFNGVVVEVCRKVRAPEDEEEGVETYSKIWGREKSVAVIVASMILSMGTTAIATNQIDAMHIALPISIVSFLFCIIPIMKYIKQPIGKYAKRLELVSGVWAITDYAALGILPLLLL